uniref:RNase III domain-containing protein n=1 Tax=Ditylenchus dipsaci TaxID=166011 RepID=A0A915D9G8_9BILA
MDGVQMDKISSDEMRMLRKHPIDFEGVDGLSGSEPEDESQPKDDLKLAESEFWSQSIVPTKYYLRKTTGVARQFEQNVVNVIERAKPVTEPLQQVQSHACSSCDHNHQEDSTSASDSSSSDEDTHSENRKKTKRASTSKHHGQKESKRRSIMIEIERKRNHPAVVHPDISYNEAGQVNDGRKTISCCDPNSSNIECLHHYVLKVDPDPTQLARKTTTITVDGLCYSFDGFSVFFHQPLPDLFPQTPINQWSSEFNIKFVRENSPESFTIRDLELFHSFLFENVMELHDLDRKLNLSNPDQTSCLYYHYGGKEILPMSSVLYYFKNAFSPFMTDGKAASFSSNDALFREYTQLKKGQIFLNPAKKPMAIRADLIDSFDQVQNNSDFYPLLTHFGIRPSAYTYVGKPEYQKALKRFVKMRHLLLLKSRLSAEDRQKLNDGEEKLKRLKAECKVKRDITVSLNSRGYYETGLYPDVIHHAMLLILACFHVRFHCSLDSFEKEHISYKFKNRALLELAFTHPSYRANYGTNPDHAKNTLNNCGIRIAKCRGPQNGVEGKSGSTRKRGISALMEIMSKQGSKKTEQSTVKHNERLEFFGDAVVEFITTVHLFYMFPELEEGGLATYRSSLVQNKHLASLAKKIHLHEFMLYAHGPDLCHESDLRHAMANAFEALMAAIMLDSDINVCDRIFSNALYGEDPTLMKVWSELLEHPLKKDNPFGDRHMIKIIFRHILYIFDQIARENIGIRFKHIRLLAKAFTRRNIGFNYLTLGHNQRLETCLVSNKTQSVICDDLAMQKYLVIPKADLVEAFLGALYVDRGLDYCTSFCRVCFFPRLKYFILTQRWNDPKSQLQQCCLTLRQSSSGDPDIPEYKTVGAGKRPTNTRVYRVVVYFRNKRLAEGTGSSNTYLASSANGVDEKRAVNADNGALHKQIYHEMIHFPSISVIQTKLQRLINRSQTRGN